MTSHVEPERKVWVIAIPEGDEYGVGPVEVLVEQFGNAPPTVAFRRERHHSWGRPFAPVAPER